MAEINKESVSAAPETPVAPKQVLQPTKVEGLDMLLSEVNDIVGEKSPAKPSEQWSSQGSTGSSTQQDDSTGDDISPRDQAIANLPSQQIMQKELTKHIANEITQLRKEARTITKLNSPGSAYKLTKLYARIRRLNNLLGSVLQSSYDVLRRLFIRVVIDKQAVV